MNFPLIAQPQGGAPRAFRTAFTIGTRGDLAVADDYASGEHARCRTYEGDWYIEDLGSTNGTLVNGVKIRGPYRLEKGDRVMIGRTVLTVVPA